MTPQEINSSLANFYGSETLTRWSMLFRRDVLTEGVKFVAEECGAYWLMDAIASHQHGPISAEDFQSWKFSKVDGDWVLSGDDGNGNVKATQAIEYTDFPLDEINVWACRNELGGVTIMLPSEY